MYWKSVAALILRYKSCSNQNQGKAFLDEICVILIIAISMAIYW